MEILTTKIFEDKSFSEYLEYLELNYERVIFKTMDGGLTIRVNIQELLDASSVLRRTLSDYPDMEFIILHNALIHSRYDLNNPFVIKYLANIDALDKDKHL